LKRSVAILLLAVSGAQITAAPAVARRAAVRPGEPRRAVVVLKPGWPLQRPPRVAVMVPLRGVVEVTSTTFLTPVSFQGNAVEPAQAPTRDVIVWEDGETLTKGDDWTEFTLCCRASGRQLWLQIPSGRVQVDWAEVVFDNGDAQVVDFGEKPYGPGLYSLFDRVMGRRIDHVRVLARSKSNEAKLVLQMAKG